VPETLCGKRVRAALHHNSINCYNGGEVADSFNFCDGTEGWVSPEQRYVEAVDPPPPRVCRSNQNLEKGVDMGLTIELMIREPLAEVRLVLLGDCFTHCVVERMHKLVIDPAC
jgi:hypothetical protein